MVFVILLVLLVGYSNSDEVAVEAVAINAWSSSHYGEKAKYGPQLAWKGDSPGASGFFRSQEEHSPWLRIELNKPTTFDSITIINRKDCCGERLKNIEIRGGMKNDLTNPVIGEFKGPGRTGGVHKIVLRTQAKVLFLTFQRRTGAVYREHILQINGIRLGFVKGLLDTVYVDAIQGRNNVTCGKTSKSPCKDLTFSVKKRVRSSGTVYINGEHHLNASVELDKDISITSSPIKPGSIKSNGTVDVAFNIIKQITLNISHLHFSNVGVVDIGIGLEIAIINIHVDKTPKKATAINRYCSRPVDWCYNKVFGVITISNSVFKDTMGIGISHMKGVSIYNCSFYDHFRLHSLKTKSLLSFYIVDAITLTECTFINTIAPDALLNVWGSKKLLINGCNFKNGTGFASGGCVSVSMCLNAAIEDSTFMECKSMGSPQIVLGAPVSGAKGGAIWGKSGIRIRRCVFSHNFAMKIGGAVYLDKGERCQDTSVYIEDSVFKNNEARRYGQAVFSNNLIMNMRNVTVTSVGDRATDYLHLKGENVIIQQVSIWLRSSGPVRNTMVKNMITIVAYTRFELIDSLNFTCPEHFNVVHEHEFEHAMSQKLKITGWENGLPSQYEPFTLKWQVVKLFLGSCVSCRSNEYTSGTGQLSLQKRTSEEYNGGYQHVTVENGQCKRCPLGAICDGNIKPVDNHWGNIISPTEMEFFQCPSGFCCSRGTVKCTSYNTCATGRTGKLCGLCNEGYSESFFSTECVLKSGVTCNAPLFIVYCVMLSLIYTVIFAFLPSIIESIKNMMEARKTPASNDNSEEDDGIIVQKKRLTADQKERYLGKEPLPLSAYITLVCFFFQVASLVHVDIQLQNDFTETRSERDSKTEWAVLETLFNFFNFRVSVYRNVCPTDELTLPMKELINVGLKLCSIFNLLLFYLAWKCVLLLKTSMSPTNDSGIHLREASKENEDGSQKVEEINHLNCSAQCRLPFASIVKIGFIKLVKFNFTSISLFMFHMIHCVTISGNLHLYLFGDLQCYTWWQQIISFVLLPLILLYPVSFGISLNLLKQRLISPTSFLCAFAMPLIALILWMKKKTVGLRRYHPSEDDELCIKEILEMEELLFTSGDQKLRWPVVQLYRNLLIVVLNTFILNQMYRLISFIPVFLGFVIHDQRCMPYKHVYLNYLQTLSSAALLVITACNVPASFSVIFDLMIVPAMDSLLVLLKYTELAMICIVPFSMVVWKTWEKYESCKDGQSDN